MRRDSAGHAAWCLFLVCSISSLLALRPPLAIKRREPSAGVQRLHACSGTGKTGSLPIIRPKSLQGMTPSEFAELHDHSGSTPSVLTDVWGHGNEGREEWCDAVAAQLADKDVEFQLQQRSHSELLEGTFEEFLECVFESTYDSAFFLFDENLMTAHADLRSKVALPESYFGYNYFETFPEDLRPKDSCLVVGGEGARSTLHADPFDWMGTNYCLEGSKLWVFIAPDQPQPADQREKNLVTTAASIAAYRVEPNAWAPEDDEGSAREVSGNAQRPEIAAGWQSDMTVYEVEQLTRGWLRSEQLGQMGAGMPLSERAREGGRGGQGGGERRGR